MDIDCFLTTGGKDPYGQQAAWLVNSIKSKYQDPTIFVGVPENEEQSTSLPSDIEIVSIKPPLKEYMVALKAGLLRWVEKKTDHNTIAVIDPDSILINRITLPDEGKFFIKPADIIFYQRLLNKNYWLPIYDAANVSFPDYKISTTVTGRKTWPYYQGGVFIESDVQIAETYLNYAKKIYEITGGEYFTEQLTLSVLATELDTTHLSESQNYPLNLRLFAPRNVELIHYKESKQLLRLPFHRNILQKLGITDWLRDEFRGWSYHKRWVTDIRNILFHRTRWYLFDDYGWERFNS